MSKYKDLTGQKFGRWTVINITDKRTKNRTIIWHCKCDCGNEKDVDGYTLKSGQSKSCGCLHKEIVKKKVEYENQKVILKEIMDMEEEFQKQLKELEELL